jgi:hypothetical protein
MLFIILSLSFLGMASAAIDAHRIDSLPGFAGGKTPSTHYSGCKKFIFKMFLS